MNPAGFSRRQTLTLVASMLVAFCVTFGVLWRQRPAGDEVGLARAPSPPVGQALPSRAAYPPAPAAATRPVVPLAVAPQSPTLTQAVPAALNAQAGEDSDAQYRALLSATRTPIRMSNFSLLPVFGRTGGVRIGFVTDASAFSATGLRSGDQILAVRGQSVHSPADAAALLRAAGGGGVAITVKRGSETMTVTGWSLD
ncbi:MAG: PDZ domain-containing protein [Gammaproteobacteria bacterium]|nr:PDZ domain-containing protein [Gammaproteobacteria bacterium]